MQRGSCRKQGGDGAGKEDPPPAAVPDSVSREEILSALKQLRELVNGLLVKLEG